MVERIDETGLSAVLKAASDPTRRAILTRLAQDGPARVTDLAAMFEMSLNSVSKHIKVLEAAGLVTRSTRWREHLIAFAPGPLAQADAWFAELRSAWEMRLEALDDLLTKESDDDRDGN